MKKIFSLLLLTAITLQGQTTGVNKLKIAANPEKTTAPRVMVQETNGDVGYVAKSSIQTDISGKVDKVVGKELSSNDYTTAEKSKLSGIASGAEVNVNADWNATSGDAQILNKPTIPSIAGLATETFVNNGLSAKENTITVGTTSQYWRGDKTWQTFDKNVIGLSNIDNTSDLNKPISTATQAALNLKEDVSNKSTSVATDGTSDTKYPSVKAVKDYVTTSVSNATTGITTTSLGLNNVNNTSDLNKPISTATQAALDLKANGSSVVNLTDDQSILGTKSFLGKIDITYSGTPAYTAGLNIANNGSGNGARIENNFAGVGLTSLNTGAGIGINVSNYTGRGLVVSNQSSGKAITIYNGYGGAGLTIANDGNGTMIDVDGLPTHTGKILSGKLNGIEKTSISHDGKITAQNFIKTGGTSSQFLKADGSVSTINDATGDATYTKQVVAKPDGTLGYENKTSESSTIYTEADCIVDTNLVQLFELLAIKKGRELIINIRFLLKSTAPTANVYTDLITMPAGIVFSKKNVIIGQRWQTNSEVSTLILEGNKIKYFGMNQPKLAFAESYFNATIIID